VATVPLPGDLAACLGGILLGPADAHVRHRWPADLTRPADGPLVLVQPWEFGSLPRAWVDPILDRVDEVWAYTTAVRDCYLAAGVPADRVRVVPLGVDPDRFHPGAPPYPLATRKATKFLFVGGTVPRKGFDLLLAAYARAFRRADDVCLVVKDMGGGTFYRGQTAEAQIAAVRSDPAAPEVEYLTADLPDDEMPGLYTACDCLVLPYRGEGFGLPVLEAMASGKPVVVTAGGATDDFCPEAAGYRLPARRTYLPDDRVGDLETVARPWWLEPDPDALAAALRRVAAAAGEARAKGAAGRRAALGWTWDHTAAAVEQRVWELRGRPPAGRVRPRSDRGRRARVSLTMIVRDEEHNLPACLDRVRGLFDEVVVADTGSADRTREVAAAHGARVVDAPWADSFAAARNAALAAATGDFAFWLDADDRVGPASRAELAALFAALDPAAPAAYVVKCRCVPDRPGGPATVVDHVRLFPVRPDVRWDFRVHEQVLPALRAAGVPVRWAAAAAAVEHVGYVDPAVRRRKLGRDLRLLELELAERPGHPFTLFNLGAVYAELGDDDRAADHLARSLAASDPRDSIVRKAYALLAGTHRRRGRAGEAAKAVSAGREVYPDDAELLFLDATLRREAGDLPGAEAALGRLLAGGEGPHFASVDDSLRGAKAHHALGLVRLAAGRAPAAVAASPGAAVAAAPGLAAGWAGLGEAGLAAGDDRLVEAAAAALDELGGGPAAAGLLSRRLIARGEYEAARRVLGPAIDRHPADVGLRVLWSHAWLGAGEDGPEAEAALRAILALDPGHPEAGHNLEVLLARRADPVAPIRV